MWLLENSEFLSIGYSNIPSFLELESVLNYVAKDHDNFLVLKEILNIILASESLRS